MYRIPGVARPLEKATRDSYADSPFVDDITLVGVPKGCVPPAMTLYDGTMDPLDHINHFKQKMMVITAIGSLKEACICKRFGSTLSGAALQWFKKEKVAIPRYDIATAIKAFRRGLHQDSDLYMDLTKHPCTAFEEVQSKAIAVIRLKEDFAPIRGVYVSDPVSRKAPVEKRSKRPKPYSRSVNKVSRSSEGKSEADLPLKVSEYGFTTNLAGLFKALKELGRRVRWPKLPAEGYSSNRKDTGKKCEFHGSNTHDTDECHSLRKEFKFHYDQGNLDHLLPRGTTRQQRGTQPENSCRINRQNLPSVTFDETNAWSAPEQHHDALIITLPIGNCEVKKILVDTGSSVNLIMLETLKGMGFTEKDLAKKAVPLVGFSGETKHSLGEIVIPTYVGGVNKQIRYLALDPRDESNSLNVPPVSEVSNALGVQEIRGDQEEAKDCYKVALKSTTSSPT
ncbi:uncharacterized protein LOC141601953 [Silene latifolia]|uniref:uncharacterized protein LOC141601953 n=1 Tax=Silene latifolia TaxID=37657 RepID=UPI003D779345